MAVQAVGRTKVTVHMTGDDKFVHAGIVVEEVWFTSTTSAVRSNTVWYRGVDFYTGAKFQSRMRVDALPKPVRTEMRRAVERLRAMTP